MLVIKTDVFVRGNQLLEVTFYFEHLSFKSVFPDLRSVRIFFSFKRKGSFGPTQPQMLGSPTPVTLGAEVWSGCEWLRPAAAGIPGCGF